MSANPRVALVLGKFMPLHRGHELLLQFARTCADTLVVVVDHLAQEAISGAQRCAWVQQTIPDAHVIYLPEPMPQYPEEHPDFWNLWRDTLLNAVPAPPSCIIASEHYGETLAALMGCRFIPFDIPRAQVPVSASDIRRDPEKHWSDLSTAAKPYYLMRICIIGPESTGKTTLAAGLAKHYGTVWVPEYARGFIEKHGNPTFADMETIARGQLELEAQHIKLAERLLFADTDPLATSIWSRWLHGEVSPALEAIAASHSYDLYLLTASDLPWIADSVRYFPDGGPAFLQDCVQAMEAGKRHWHLVEGSGPARLQQAIRLVDKARKEFFIRKISGNSL